MIDLERSESGRFASEELEKAAFLEKLEQDAHRKKAVAHRIELEKLIEERARDNKLQSMPVTNETLR